MKYRTYYVDLDDMTVTDMGEYQDRTKAILKAEEEERGNFISFVLDEEDDVEYIETDKKAYFPKAERSQLDIEEESLNLLRKEDEVYNRIEVIA